MSHSSENAVSHQNLPIEVPIEDRCRFSSGRKGRCTRVFTDEGTGLCIVHGRLRSQKLRADALRISEEILGDGPNLEDRDEVRAAVSNLFRVFAEKRIDRTDAALLAYMSSLVLQSLPLRIPQKEEKPEYHVVWDIPPAKKDAEPGDSETSSPGETSAQC